MAELAKFSLNWRNFRVLKEMGVEEHDVDVRFKSGSGNMDDSCNLHAAIIMETIRSL